MPSRQGRTAIPQRRRRGEARCSLPKGTNGHQPSDQIRAKVSIDCCLAISKTSNGPETGSTEDRVLGTQFESSRLHHAFRLPRRFPGHPVITAQLADLFGVSFVSARVSVNFSGMFRRLRLCAQKSVSRKQRLRFEEQRSNAGLLLSEDQASGMTYQVFSSTVNR